MKNQQLFSKNLAAYSGLATALLSSAHAEAQIVYVNPPDIIVSDGNYPVDLNNDGVYDFRFLHSEQNYLVFYGYDEYCQILEGNDCFFYLHPPRVIPEGELIKRSPVGLWTPIEYYSDAGLFCEPGGSCSYVPWPGKSKKFFAFRFKDHPGQNKFNYGWMRVSVGNDCQAMKIHDWAYNSDPGAPIQAGQTERIAHETIQEEADLVVYATGRILHIDNNATEEPLDITLFNTNGQLFSSAKTSESSTEVDLHLIPAGILLVNVKGISTNHTWKVAVQ